MPEFVCGRHTVFHLLSAGRRKGLCLHLLKGSEKERAELVEIARKLLVPVRFEAPAFFSSKLPPGISHQGVALEVAPYPYLPLDELLSESFLLVLDEIQDPQNLGALCRSAYLFGVGGVVIPETHAAPIGPGSLQASVGAIEYLKISQVSSIAKILELLKKNNFWVYGADQEGDRTIYDEAYPEKVALVIGGEEKGLRRLVRERCDLLVKIPTVGKEIGSLNASVAGGVILSEIFRQKSKKNSKT